MRGSSTRGQSLAEFALVLPIFLILVLTLFDLGRAVFVYNGLTNAVREGARLAIVNQDKDLIAERSQSMAFGVGIETDTTFLHQLSDADGERQPCPDINVPVGCVAVVEARATWRAITPLSSILGLVVRGDARAFENIDLTARSEQVVEFKCPNTLNAAYATAEQCPKQP